jgi:lipopolysaccharide transport system ATP-binding protein
VLGANTAEQTSRPALPAGSVGHARLRFTLPHLNGGPYMLTAAIASGTQSNHVTHHWVHDAMALTVHNPRHLGTSIVLPLSEGLLRPQDPLHP